MKRRYVAKTDDRIALDAIHELLDGKEWSSDTLDAIADVLRDIGYPIREYDGEA